MEEFLTGPAEEQQEPTPVVQEVEAPAPGPQRDENGRFTAKGDELDAPPASEGKAKGQEAAIVAERRKRQEAEQRSADLERQIAELRQPKAPPAPPPSVWEDEQGYGDHLVNTAVEGSAYQARLVASEIAMMQSHDNFASLKNELYQFVGSNPAVNAEVANSPHPWKTAFDAYQKHSFAQELNATNMDELKAQLLEQLKAEQASAAPAQQQPQIPQSLAGEQSARGGNPGAQPANQSLKDILGR